jgi:hypothetical protein
MNAMWPECKIKDSIKINKKSMETLVYIHGTTTSPHRQGAYTITTSIFRELHAHKHPCRCASNPNKENLQRRQPPSKILKDFS